MKLTNDIKSVLAILLISHSLTGLAQPSSVDSANSPTPSESKPIASENGSGSNKQAKSSKPYSGYSVDGRTSASVLAAQRSHSVSKEDETGLAVYSGLFVIAVIAFFVRTLSKNK